MLSLIFYLHHINRVTKATHPLIIVCYVMAFKWVSIYTMLALYLLYVITIPIPTVVMICGYKGSGKDTFYKNRHTDQWVMYKEGRFYNIGITLGTRYKRLGLADQVKTDVIELLRQHNKLPQQGIEWLESNKDIPFYKTHACTLSYRDLLKSHAAKQRKISTVWWVAQLNTNILFDNIMVTDWRYINERDYLAQYYHIITVRVVRNEVRVPASTDRTEHELDNYPTDYLVVPRDKCFDHLNKANELAFKTC